MSNLGIWSREPATHASHEATLRCLRHPVSVRAKEVCDECGKEYGSRDRLQHHQRAAHNIWGGQESVP
jgi:hypothetical protein